MPSERTNIHVPQAERPSAAWLGGVLAALLVATLCAAYLTHLHAELFFGQASEALCDLSAGFSCTEVNGSDWSHIGPVPIALLGIPTYAVMAVLALRGFQKGRESAETALLAGLGTLTCAYSVFLIYISSFVLHAYCIVCITMYVMHFAITGLAFVGRREPLPDTLMACARALTDPGRSMAEGAGAFALALALGWGAYTVDYKSQLDAAIAEATAPMESLESADPQTAGVQAPPKALEPPPVTEPSTTTKGTGEPKKVRIQASMTEIDVPKEAFVQGPKNAPVEVISFVDFQCPFCRRLASVLRALHDEYPKDVELAIVVFPMNADCNPLPEMKNPHMHPEACNSGIAAICAGQQGKFFEAHDVMFQDQGNLGEPMYAGLADRLGLDNTKYAACRADPKTADFLRSGAGVGVDAGVGGTPTTFVNGRLVSGPQPIEVFRAVVEAELAHNGGMLDLEVTEGSERVGDPPMSAPVSVTIGSYAIDAFEATIEGGKAVSKPGAKVATGISWYDAKRYCEASGKRLCSAEEWYTACTGKSPRDKDGDGDFYDDAPDGHFYAYGDMYQPGTCADSRNPEAAGELIAGNHPGCRTDSGIYDLQGNVKEWIGLDPSTAALAGGSYSSGDSARCAYRRQDVAPEVVDPTNGVRCCSGPAPTVDTSQFPGGKTGDKLQAFTLEKLGGGTVSSNDLAGHPAIITFWASWCGPCREEMPILSTLAAKYESQGLKVLGISIDEQTDKAKSWVSANNIGFLIGLDPTNAVHSRFMGESVPTTFWVRADGTIRLRTVGLPSGKEKRLEELVNELIAAR